METIYACNIFSGKPLWKAFAIHNFRDGVITLDFCHKISYKYD